MNGRTKALVGIISCTASLLLLSLQSCTTLLKHEMVKSLIKKTPEFHALANVAGFLAFDLWYDRMCCRKFPPRLLCILENATTLSVFSAILTKWEEWGVSSFVYTTPCIALWLGYKICRFVLDILGDDDESTCSDVIGGSTTVVGEGSGSSTSTSTSTTLASTVLKENLWTIHGKDYDLGEFVKRHPGGKEAILLGRGRDCTALFDSYHPFTNRHRDVLKKYKAVDVEPEQASENKSQEVEDYFYEVMKERVGKTLRENGFDPTKDRAANTLRTLYYFFIIGLLVVSGSYHVAGNPFGSFLFAVFGWLVGCLGHDAGHFAASRIPFVNDAGVWGISFLCNPIMWQHQHTFAHHSHTNDVHNDPDLHHFGFLLRVHRKFQHRSIYKNQTNIFYVIAVYALVVFGECVKIPLGMMKTGFLYDIVEYPGIVVEYTDRKRPLRAFGTYVHYVGYLALIVVSPFFSGKSFSIALSCGLIHIVTAGWLFAVFSQINHLNEFSIEIERGETDEKILKNSWAARQVATSNNFAIKSLFWHFFSNGLNMQIEHHLFPGLNHCHLHLIQPTVQKTCEEFGVHYKSFESWSEVMGATLQWLDKLSS